MIKILENLKKTNDIPRLYSAETTTPLWGAFYWLDNQETNTTHLLLVTSGHHIHGRLLPKTLRFLVSPDTLSGPAQK